LATGYYCLREARTRIRLVTPGLERPGPGVREIIVLSDKRQPSRNLRLGLAAVGLAVLGLAGAAGMWMAGEQETALGPPLVPVALAPPAVESAPPELRPAVPAPEVSVKAPVLTALRPLEPALGPESLRHFPPRVPTWMRHAAAQPNAGDRPLIAIVIDDLGHNEARVGRAIALAAPMTLAFLPYGRGLPALVARARAAGHEILVHIPMEPLAAAEDPGPEALLTGLAPDELRRRLRWNLARFEGYVGVNNHMGSRFSADEDGMALVMAEIKARDLLFVDSRTTAATVGTRLARRYGVPEAQRDVFLDDVRTSENVRHALERLEEVALKQGYAVAIGHPHAVTLKALEEWLAGAEARGFVMAPVSAIVRRRLSTSVQDQARR
jgi:polysaccharide deacetylase 2 family uncharacterized protein YibQ